MEPFTKATGIVAPLDRLNVDTDSIVPARFLKRIEREGWGETLFFDWRFLPDGRPNPEFILNAPGYEDASILVVGRNFGGGSSREHAQISIKGADVSCVIAKSFARIFFRNAINLGLPVLECSEAVDGIDSGDELDVDLSTGTIRNLTTEQVFKAKPFEPFMLEIIEAGGLVEYTKQRLAAQAS